MPSYSSVWVPALAVAHAAGTILFLYAIQQIGGALTYWCWLFKYLLIYKSRYKGDFKKAWYYTYPGAKKAYDEANGISGTESKGPPIKVAHGPESMTHV